ncbi:MAG: Gfo/Idh/MocA family oxidoreductase [Planctomycetota bacterium]
MSELRKQKPVTWTSSRRRFLSSASLAAASTVAVPSFVSAETLGLGKSVPPSDRITVGGIGIGRRGTYDLGCFLEQPDVQFIAICDIKEKQRNAIKERADQHHGNSDCDTHRDFRELLARDDIDSVLIATGPNWHATAATYAARAGKDIYCEKPCTKNIVQSLQLAETMNRSGVVFQAGTQRRNLPHFEFACMLAREGRLGKLQTVHAQPRGMKADMSGWMPPEDAPPIEKVDWNMYLGPAAYRPYNEKLLDGFNFEKGGGLTGGGVLEWGSHCVDLCQWAADADSVPAISYKAPENNRIEAEYPNGVKLVLRDDGWLPLGSCPVRFEGTEGWVETGDSGKLALSSPELLAGRKVEEIGGYPATFHVRDFLDCVKTRSVPRAGAEAACYAHITCHAANVALYLNRDVSLDPDTYEFINDDEANRLRNEAFREPWQI